MKLTNLFTKLFIVMQAGECGFIAGFLTDKTWARNMLDKLKEQNP